MTRRSVWMRAGPALLAVLAVGGLAAVEVRQAEHALVDTASRLVRRSFGDAARLDGPVEARLLPRPYLLMHDLRVASDDGAVRLDVPLVEATPTFTSVLLGRVDVVHVRLIEPTASVDVDRLGAPDAAFDLVRHMPAKVTVSGGVLALRSASPAASGLMTGLDAVLAGAGRNGAAVLSGHATWRGQHAELTARFDPVFDFILGRPTAASLRLHLPALTAAVDGQLHAGIRGGFVGSVTAATPALGALLAANGLPSHLGAVVHRAAFSATGVAGADAVTFSNARVMLDATTLEGSLAWQPNGGHGTWTGTFATDALDLTEPLKSLAAWDREGRWSDAPFAIDSSLWGGVDLRVSAGQATLGPVSLEDAAFSALCRNGRVEVSLSEARASDGLVRGRAVANLQPASVDLKVDLSMAQLDLASLGWPGVSGVASGHVAAEAHGGSPRRLIANLGGRGQVSVRQGTLPPLRAVADVSSLPAVPAAWEAPASFDLGSADLAITGGAMGIADGRLVGTAGEHRFGGRVSLLDRTFALTAVETPQDAVADRHDEAASGIAGTWGRPVRVLRVEQAGTATGRMRPTPAAANLLR